jgi:ABC-type multidrug transport system fused ATPase/permease subunit
MVTHA